MILRTVAVLYPIHDKIVMNGMMRIGNEKMSQGALGFLPF